MGLALFTSRSATYKAKQKPRQWGPLSAVRSAVYHNAERLGIDPASIVGLWPLWEEAGSTSLDVINGNILTRNGNTSWVGDGVYIGPASGDYLSAPRDTTLEPTEQITVVLHCYLHSLPVAYSKLLHYGQNSAAPYGPYRIERKSTTNNLMFVVANDATYGTSSPAVAATPPMRLGLVGTYDGSQVRLWANSEYLGGTVGTGPIRDYGTYGLGIGDKPQTGQPSEITVHFCLIANQAVHDVAAAALAARPYALIRPVARPLVLDLGAGTVYNLSIFDGFKTSDSGFGGLSLFTSISDGLKTSDTDSGALSISAGVSDGLKTADGDNSITNFLATLYDTTIASDLTNIDTGLTLTVSDGLVLSDTADSQVTYYSTVFDGTTLSDALSIASVFNTLTYDSLVVSDVTALDAAIELLVADGIIAADQASALKDFLVTVSDSTITSDSASAVATFDILITDGAKFADVVNSIFNFSASISDGATLSDKPIIISTTDGVSIVFHTKNKTWRFNIKVLTYNFKTH